MVPSVVLEYLLILYRGEIINVLYKCDLYGTVNVAGSIKRCEKNGTQLYKGFPWFTGAYWPMRFYFTTVSCGDSGQSGLALQLFPVETIVTSNLIGQNKRIVQ